MKKQNIQKQDPYAEYGKSPYLEIEKGMDKKTWKVNDVEGTPIICSETQDVVGYVVASPVVEILNLEEIGDILEDM